MSAEPVPRPWRRFLRFSVRGMIVVVLGVGAGLGWFERSARIQRDAVAAIKNAGGTVAYDWEWSSTKVLRGGRPWAPQWLVDLIGVDYFGHVTDVAVSGTGSDVSIAQIGHLTGLERLFLDHANLNYTGMAHLKELSNLSTLMLIGSPVTDEGLAHLKGMTKLSTLDLRRTQVADFGLTHLKGLESLSTLSLGGRHVTDAGLAHLKGLPALSILSLDCVQVTDAGLAHLKGLTKLSLLDLRGTQVTDAGVKELQRALPSLTINR